MRMTAATGSRPREGGQLDVFWLSVLFTKDCQIVGRRALTEP